MVNRIKRRNVTDNYAVNPSCNPPKSPTKPTDGNSIGGQDIVQCSQILVKHDG